METDSEPSVGKRVFEGELEPDPGKTGCLREGPDVTRLPAPDDLESQPPRWIEGDDLLLNFHYATGSGAQERIIHLGHPHALQEAAAHTDRQWGQQLADFDLVYVSRNVSPVADELERPRRAAADLKVAIRASPANSASGPHHNPGHTHTKQHY